MPSSIAFTISFKLERHGWPLPGRFEGRGSAFRAPATLKRIVLQASGGEGFTGATPDQNT